jgi:sporulation protein YlmC with PRC-barrel domain
MRPRLPHAGLHEFPAIHEPAWNQLRVWNFIRPCATAAQKKTGMERLMIKHTLIAGVTALALMTTASIPAMAQSQVDYIAQQQSGEWLASRMIGVKVENSSGEALGDVNDLILGQNGEVVGAVIGVGGFLGMGEKNVAVPYSAVSTTQKDDATVVLLAATKEELQAAPDYSDLKGNPLSVSKRWRDQASEAYRDAKEKATDTYNEAKEKMTTEENKTQVQTQ